MNGRDGTLPISRLHRPTLSGEPVALVGWTWHCDAGTPAYEMAASTIDQVRAVAGPQAAKGAADSSRSAHETHIPNRPDTKGWLDRSIGKFLEVGEVP